MKFLSRTLVPLVVLTSVACGTDAQQSSELVKSSDRELGALAAALLPDLARRSGLELKEPVRLEMRSRAQLVEYLTHKLDEELTEEDANHTVQAYALLGLVPDTLDLRALLLSLYTEQVAGFYEPDSTALFILDDQPVSALQPLLVHELVHAVQDQSVDLETLTDPALGNDRGIAAQAALEGHATLVMLEFLTEQMRGAPVDLSEVPDFASTLRPALQAMGGQFPALAGAPRVLQQALLFPYVEGAGYVQRLWMEGGRAAPFGPALPLSTEQIVTSDLSDPPLRLALDVRGGEVLYEDDMGWLEMGVLLETHLDSTAGVMADGWGGDRFALVTTDSGPPGLALLVAWDSETQRNAFVTSLGGALGGFPQRAELRSVDVDGRPAALLTVGLPSTVQVEGRIVP